MSELKRIHEWNEVAGNTKIKRNIDDEKIIAQWHLIVEEYEELARALVNAEINAATDMSKVLKEACDCIVVITGLINALGYDTDSALKLVNDSNFSKFCYNMKDVEDSMSAYEECGRYSDVFSEHINGLYVIKGVVEETGSVKILKGINYKECNMRGVE